MNEFSKNILVINSGSSSIKFALFSADYKLVRKIYGKIERIGLGKSTLSVIDEKAVKKNSYAINVKDITEATDFLINWLEDKTLFADIVAIGHRLVHGMANTEAKIITQRLLDELKSIISYDPDHLPGEILLIETFIKRYPHLLQVACFDTSFHTTMPRMAKLLPLPRRFEKLGVKRYGFHGLSYNYIMQELENINASQANGRVIIAHLGGGASMVAVKQGKSIDTSMGFTPAGGFMMGTRPGDLDPGVTWYMMQQENMSPSAFNDIINHKSGLLGIAETSSDMQDLLKIEEMDSRAKDAIQLFCYQAKKYIGSFTAVLGGLDILVFTGGVGENAPSIRKRITEGLEFIGIDIDSAKNEKNEKLVSANAGRVKVYVLPTNEELMIAKITVKLQSEYGS